MLTVNGSSSLLLKGHKMSFGELFAQVWSNVLVQIVAFFTAIFTALGLL